MAKIINNSQAWQSIIKTLALRDMIPEKLGSISKILDIKQKKYQLEKLNATLKVDGAIQTLTNEFEANKKDFLEKLTFANELTKSRVNKNQAAINFLQKEKGALRKIFNIFKIRKLKSNIRAHINKRKKYGALINSKLTAKQNALKALQERREQLIENECKEIKADVSILEQALNSPEFKGAIGELGLIENLSKLPDDFIIINDVRLTSDEAIYFDGEWLRSAQIDHIVVSPYGVFVIEAKN